MTHLFAPCLFQVHILELFFFQGRKPTHVFKTRIVGENWMGNYMLFDIDFRDYFFFLALTM